MKWFRRRRRLNRRPFDDSEFPDPAPLSVEDAVSEGLMLAEYASRMRLKNRIIVGVLTRQDPFAADQYRGAARAALETLATESRQGGDRIADELRAAAELSGSARHAHDYRSSDADNLKHRETVLHTLAQTLHALRDDSEYLSSLIEGARQDAWSDISRAIEDVLDRSNIVVDAAYKRERAKRMRLLVSEDLAGLAKKAAG